MTVRFSTPANRHFDSLGVPLSGGKLTFYESGSTTTLQDTWADAALTTVNPNPVILSKSGLEPNIFLDGAYRVTLENSDGVQIWARDNVNDEVQTTFGDWMSTISYGAGGNNIVTGSDGNYYVSLQDPNLGNDPTTSPAFWSQIKFVGVWNTNETYAVEDVVQYTIADGSSRLYAALVSQAGNAPEGDTTNWQPLAQLAPGETTNQQSYRQAADASLGTGTHTFDYAIGDMQQLTATGNITIAFSNFPTGNVVGYLIDAVDWGAHTITLPGGVLFSNGVTPTFTTSGTDRIEILKDKDDVYTLTIKNPDLS